MFARSLGLKSNQGLKFLIAQSRAFAQSRVPVWGIIQSPSHEFICSPVQGSINSLPHSGFCSFIHRVSVSYSLKGSRTGIHLFTRSRIHSFICSEVHLFTQSGIHLFTHSGIHSVTHLGVHSFTHSGFHSFTRLGIHLFTHSGIHSFTCSGIQPNIISEISNIHCSDHLYSPALGAFIHQLRLTNFPHSGCLYSPVQGFKHSPA